MQRKLAWPLRKDDTQLREAFHIFKKTKLVLITKKKTKHFSLLPEFPCTEQKITERELFSRATAECRKNQKALRNDNNHNLPFQLYKFHLL